MIILIWLAVLVVLLLIVIQKKIFAARLNHISIIHNPNAQNLFFADLPLTSYFTEPIKFWPSHPMQKRLNAYLQKEITASDFAIHYYIGGGLGGKTDFRLHGDGKYELWSTATRGRFKKSYCGQVPTCQVEQVAEEMLATKVWKVRHEHANRWLDDAGAQISVFAKGDKSEVMLWLSEVRESPSFATAQKPLLALIHDISGGEVLENGQ